MTDLEAHRVAELVNRHGIDQLTASRMVWCPELLDAPVPPPAGDGSDVARGELVEDHAPQVEQLKWARARGLQIVRQRLRDVIAWLYGDTDPMALYRAGKGEGRG